MNRLGMDSWLVWISWPLLAFGLAWIAGFSRTTFGFRGWLYRQSPLLVELLECPGCVGVYIGFFGGYLLTGRFLGALWWAIVIPASNLLLARASGILAAPRRTDEQVQARGEENACPQRTAEGKRCGLPTGHYGDCT